ncbi:MAG: shikimate kinase [Gammaproteobacteria bacterium]|jgi:shikimate kinase
MNIILCGFKNSGKTTVGKVLAKMLHYQFDDIDTLLEEYYRKENNEVLGAAEIYTKHGQDIFRKLESDVVHKLENLDNRVIALGGGTVLDPSNVKHLHHIGKIVYLRASKALLKGRMRQRSAVFIDPKSPDSAFETMYEARYKIYDTIADITIDIDGKSPEQIAKEIIHGQ